MNTPTTYKPAVQTVDIPDQIGSLPIFALMKNNLQNISSTAANQVATTPEGKKTVSNLIFWGILGFTGYFLYNNYTKINDLLSGMINMSWQLLVLIGYVAIFIFLYSMRGYIVGWFHKIGAALNRFVSTEIFKKEKAYVQSNAIATLQLKALDADASVTAAENGVTDVEAAQNNALGEAKRNENEAKEKYSYLVQCNNAIQDEIMPALTEAKANKDSAKISSWTRKLSDMTANAAIAKSEYEAATESKNLYAQFANQIAKMIDILRDNAVSARIMAKALRSSIRIIEKKLETTSNINRATKNIAGAFDIKNSWDFDVAMNAVNMAIDQNIAQIKTNIRFADQSRGVIAGTISAGELNSFVTGMKDVKPLNLTEIASSAHELTAEEIVDPTFNILS